MASWRTEAPEFIYCPLCAGRVDLMSVQDIEMSGTGSVGTARTDVSLAGEAFFGNCGPCGATVSWGNYMDGVLSVVCIDQPGGRRVDEADPLLEGSA